MNPSKLIFTGYICIIVMGWLILSLPVSSSGEPLNTIDSLFTATSSICVTGLIVKDTPNDFSLFGHIIILILIQIGGLGYMTVGSLLFLTLRRRLSIRQSTVVSNSISVVDVGTLGLLIKRIVLFTLLFEGLGMFIFAYRFTLNGLKYPFWPGLFHSVSAFCNAGFSLFSNSFIGFQNDPVVLLTASTLFIIGGMGFIVLSEITAKKKKRLSLHARMVLLITSVLLVVGTLVFLFSESGNLLSGHTIWKKLLISYFQAATPRTAGFTALNLGYANTFTLFLLTILMFIGASPGGTGGGVKTTTFGICFLSALRYLQGKQDVNLLGKRINEDNIRRAFHIIILSLFLICLGILVLSLEGLPFERVFFEELSAFGTVGLSTGSLIRDGVSLSHDFSVIGKLMIIISMFVGRIGPLTLGLAILERKKTAAFRYSEESLQIG